MEDPNVHPHWAAETKMIARRLDRLDYFQLLGATPEATHEDLRARYHQLQRNYHPDSFFTSPDTELKRAVNAIAKRVAEAWVILRDPEKRAKYTRDVGGPERAQRLRYTEDSDREARKERESSIARTTQGRSLWTKAQAAIRSGDYASAERDLRTGLVFEADNQRFREKLEEVIALMEGAP
ncbi:MAG: DnaJ domain-containing protein [Myxococcota bacterium]